MWNVEKLPQVRSICDEWPPPTQSSMGNPRGGSTKRSITLSSVALWKWLFGKPPPMELVHVKAFTTHASAKTLLQFFRQLQHRTLPPPLTVQYTLKANLALIKSVANNTFPLTCCHQEVHN